MRLALATVVCCASLCEVVPALAAEDATTFAQRGATAFKAGQYLDAARNFERAWQLDPADNKNLRYAGRAWQEVGHWHKARLLLERYVEVEKDAALRQSVIEKLGPLHSATPVEIAEALAKATGLYPQGKLEPEAAQALEDLGDERSLRRAASLWEVAKLAATTEADRTQAVAAGRRLKEKLRAPVTAPASASTTPATRPADPQLAPPESLQSPKVATPQDVAAPLAAPPAPPPPPHTDPPLTDPPRRMPTLQGEQKWRTPVGWTLASAGLATTLGGLFLLNGTLADADAWDRKVATKDASGKVTGFGTGPDAERRSADAAAAINRGWLVGGGTTAFGLGLGVAGVVLLQSQPDVAIVPSARGVTVAGRF
ncbi:MAG: tetratricopeptide repeat protein [Myxococcales bacterium]|nr:tetratricopeptide repeat protein [Myxococcales bacterium]